MPSDAGLSGRCYCGATSVQTNGAPSIVTYCHCTDCRRVSGAPIAALAAFAADGVEVSKPPKTVSVVEGATRAFCETCGTPVMAWYDYLPGQVYVSVGIFDDAEALAPTNHSHFGAKLSWLCLQDDLPKATGSARARLQAAK